MPHIRLFVTGNIDAGETLRSLVETLSKTDSIEPSAVKGYQFLCPQWVVGEGGPAGFVHCEVSVLAGRSKETRAKIAEEMWRVLSEHLSAHVTLGEAGLTVEVREMEPDSYKKRD
jgi:5-carboxymethyl-2-hydroxymuconate isomerase